MWLLEKEKLNVAVLGCGVISKSHLEDVKANSELVELYAVSDIDEEKAIKATGNIRRKILSL